MLPQTSDRRGTKQSLEALIEALELSDLQKQFLRSRWLGQVSWMGSRAKNARSWYYGLRLTAIIGSIIFPILVSLNTGNRNRNENVAAAVRWSTIGLSGLIAISAAVEEFFHYGDRWRHYRRTEESLKTQGWQFSQLSGFYHNHQNHQDAFPIFADQVESILQRDVEVYVTEVVREKEKKQQYGEQSLPKESVYRNPAETNSMNPTEGTMTN